MTAADDLARSLSERFGELLATPAVARGEVTVDVAPENLVEVCRALRDEAAFEFKQLIDIAGVDYLHYGKADWETSETATNGGFSRGVQSHIYDEQGGAATGRFVVVYHLLSHSKNRRLRLRCPVSGDPPRLESVIDIWRVADWYEREAFDLFGILFEGHPDLRRILTDYGFIGHPFRKDFPLSGEVEMRYDPDKRRVVYEPVSIEPRILVPKVIRHDARYAGGEEAVEDGTGDA